MLTRIKLIKLDEKIINWLEQLDLWAQVEKGIIKDNLIPIDIETLLKEKLKLDDDCKKLLNKLLTKECGLPIEELGVNVEEFLKEPIIEECPSSRLIKLRLIRIQKKCRKLKALPISFDKRAHYLLGLTKSI